MNVEGQSATEGQHERLDGSRIALQGERHKPSNLVFVLQTLKPCGKSSDKADSYVAEIICNVISSGLPLTRHTADDQESAPAKHAADQFCTLRNVRYNS